MRRMLLPLFAMVLVLGNCSKEAPTFPWVEGNFQKAMSEAKADGNKLVMVEFSTDWCVWCKRLAKDTWPDPAVIAFADEHLVPIEVDAEKGDGIELAKKYRVGGYPTMVFLNADGEEVDRIPGYLQAADMVQEMTRIVNGVDTYPALKAKVDKNPNDPALLIKFAQKVEDMRGLLGAISYWEKVPDMANSDANQIAEAQYKIAQYKVEQSTNPAALENYIKAYPDSPYIPQAYNGLSGYYRKAKDADGEANVLQQYVAFMEQHNSASTQLYNGYAWRMSELEKNLDDALAKINKGIEMLPASTDSTARAQVLDTKAEVLWKMGRAQDAVKVADQCIALQPQDEYYMKQKTKFSTVGNGAKSAS